ncbi:MAG: hypothetical protein VX913_15945 [Planctomycetota bacterium]|nr:hypothetical protein [Planctomycetota bacterium]
MSQVARVFVVLNLVIAAGFLFAAATFLALNNDYKNQLEAEKKVHADDNQARDLKIGQLNDEVKSQQSQISALREQTSQKDGTISTQNTQIQSLQGDKSNLTAENASLIEANRAHADAVAKLQDDNKGLRDSNGTLATENRAKTKEAADAVAAKEAADKGIEDLKTAIHGHEKTITAQTESLSEKDLLIAYAKQKGVDFEKIQMAPNMSGHVVNADNGLRLVQVNIGKSKGMVRGAVLDVVRGDTYIGRVRIDTVFDNQSAGLLTIMADGQSVMVGDRVTNTLN